MGSLTSSSEKRSPEFIFQAICHELAAWLESLASGEEEANEFEAYADDLACEGGLDGVVDVDLEDGLVDLAALGLYCAKVSDDVLFEDVFDAAKAEAGLKAAGEAAEMQRALLP